MSLRVSPGAKKRCRKCGEVKHVGFFRAQRRACKTCEYARRDLTGEQAAARRYRDKNRVALNKKQMKRAKRIYRWMDKLKCGPCSDCRETFPSYVMDWDHVRGVKKYNMGALRSMYSYKKIKYLVLKEIAKCELVCSNCHRVRTHERRIDERS